SRVWGSLSFLTNPAFISSVVTLPLFFLFNFLIFMGPMMAMGIAQVRGFQPGDAEWGVKLEHVRGQAEAKEEIRRIVTLWQSGELVLETRAWRDRQFALRAPERPGPSRLNAIVNQAFPGGMFGGSGQLALNQLLVVMDGLDAPPLGKRLWANSINTLLDA